MKVKDEEKLNNPLKGWQILSAISSMVFHTVHCEEKAGLQRPQKPQKSKQQNIKTTNPKKI